MAKRGAIKNYRFGQKNNWRRTVWNAVLRRTNGRERTHPILYLAGPEDIDRRIAVGKGVPNQNLIAIDIDEKNVNSVRSIAAPALHARANDVLRNWPESRPVAAVMLDLCCGLSEDALDSLDLLMRYPFRDAVVMINMLRGRDAWSNSLREWITRFDNMPIHFICGPKALEHCGKHRGMQLMSLLSLDLVDIVFRGKDLSRFVDFGTLDEYIEPEDRQAKCRLVIASHAHKDMDPQYWSYKSGALTFDSVVFHSVFRGVAGSDETWGLNGFIQDKDPEVARQIAAVMAVRTRRLSAS